MRIVRTVSRTVARWKPSLHDHHKPSVIPRAMLPSNTPLKFHRAIHRDISLLFKVLERDEQSKSLRLEAFERLRNLVQALGNNNQYDLLDISIDSIHGLPSPFNAPLECVIVDKLHPEGLPPSYGIEVLPTAYDAIALAKHLGANGYKGTFIDTKPDLQGYNSSDGMAYYSPCMLQPEPCWGDLAASFSSMFNVLPPVLRILQESANYPEIHLNPVHPSHQLRWSFLKQICEISSSFRTLSSAFWFWLRSQNIEHYSWTTCAFLVLYYLRSRNELPTHPTTDAQPPAQEFWNRVDCGTKIEYERLQVPQVPDVPDFDDRLGLMLLNFFSYWSSNNISPYTSVFNPLSGIRVPRERKYKENRTDHDERRVMRELRSKSEKGIKDAFWAYNPLVLVDPFLKHHNLAHSVTKHALQLMSHRAHSATLVFRSGRPVTDIFISGVQACSQSSKLQEATLDSQSMTTKIGFQRLYSTSARPRLNERQREIPPPPQVPQGVRAARQRAIRRVQYAIQKKYGRQLTVECFGSTQYGVDSPTSDLDLVILDHNRKTGFSPEVDTQFLPLVYSVKNLARTLERNNFRVASVVPSASVPIVKFVDPETQMNCDINVNDRLGLFNTKLIGQYCVLSPVLRPLLVLIKKWAKSLGLNNPSGERGAASFSSYSLTLMTIGFLQEHDLLPNLQTDLPPVTDDEGFWLRGKNDKRTRCDPRFGLARSWTPPSSAIGKDLREALSAWFLYWGHQYRYAHDVMSIRDGGVVPRTDKAEMILTADKKRKKRTKAKRDAKADAGPSTRDSQKSLASEIESMLSEGEATAGEDPDQLALEEMYETDLENGKQPRSWAQAALVVADPFILSKNATSSIIVRVLESFTAECRRALIVLSSGADFEDLLGDGSPIGRGGSPRRNRRARGEFPRGRKPSRGRKASRSKSPAGGRSKVARMPMEEKEPAYEGKASPRPKSTSPKSPKRSGSRHNVEMRRRRRKSLET